MDLLIVTDAKTYNKTYIYALDTPITITLLGLSVRLYGCTISVNDYMNLREMDEQGAQPLYRPKTRKRVETHKERRKKMDWFNKRSNISVMLVPTLGLS